MTDYLDRYPALAKYLDDSEQYDVSCAEFTDGEDRYLIVTQRGDVDGGQLRFRITEGHLEPVEIATIINVAPHGARMMALAARAATLTPAQQADVDAVAGKMTGLANKPADASANTKFSTSAGPDGGNLACVWAVRHLVFKALNRWITRSDSTSDFARELQNGYGQSFKEADLPDGSIIISPTVWSSGNMQGRHGHVGLLGAHLPNGDRLIYSNSSTRARWEQNFTLSAWVSRYKNTKGLDVLFYPIPGAAAAARATPSTISSRTMVALEAPPAASSDDASQIQPILDFVAQSPFRKFKWSLGQGVMPIGYMKGMALAYARVYCKLLAFAPEAIAMAVADRQSSKTDALSWYAETYANLGLDNSAHGVATLRNLFNMLIGLGVHESSGRYFCGRDKNADFTQSDSAEAGLFQTSYGARIANANMQDVYAAYKGHTDFLDVFKEGVAQPDADNLKNWGNEQEGLNWQKLTKQCPAFAVEYAALCLRYHRGEFGTIRDRKVEVTAGCDAFFRGVEQVIADHGISKV
jgi:hypothetical protein